MAIAADERHEEYLDKSAWGDGPWQGEPDRVEWHDEATGLPCLLKRSHMGAWCGYAGVPPGHPWHGLHYDDIPAYAYHGLTYADRCQEDGRPMRERICHVPRPGEPDAVWWLGFDCEHGDDYVPKMEASGYGWASFGIERPCTYKTLAFAQREVTRLAAQAAAAAV
jgi:hypothetical protein